VTTLCIKILLGILGFYVVHQDKLVKLREMLFPVLDAALHHAADAFNERLDRKDRMKRDDVSPFLKSNAGTGRATPRRPGTGVIPVQAN